MDSATKAAIMALGESKPVTCAWTISGATIAYLSGRLVRMDVGWFVFHSKKIAGCICDRDYAMVLNRHIRIDFCGRPRQRKGGGK